MLKLIDAKQAWIIGLTVECPLGEHEEGCVVGAYRKMSLIEAHRIFMKIPETELEAMLQEHRCCLSGRDH